MNIAKKASKGFISLFYRNMLEKLVGMLAMIVLARKLTPYDFGLVSITDVLLSLIAIFGTTGLTEFLVAYRKDDTEEIFKAAFWFNIVITLAIIAAFLIAVPFWSEFQKDPRILRICGFSLAIFFFSQMQGIPKTWLNRNLQFDVQVKIQAPFILLIAAGKVAAALYGLGVYSLLIPTIIIQPIQTILLYRAAKMPLSFKLYINRWKEIYHFTKHLIGAGILSRIAEQGDKIILSKVFGLATLGIYNIAMQLADLITSQIVMVSNNILASVLPKYVNDKERFYTHYSNFLKLFSFVLFPVFGLLFVAAKPLIIFVYGPQWIDAVLPMQVLLLYAVYRSVTSSYGSVMNAFHLNKESFKVILIYTPFHLLASYTGSHFGIVGLAAGVVIVKSIFVNINIAQMMRAMEKPFIQWYKNLAPYFITTIVIAGGLFLVIHNTHAYNYTAPIIAIAAMATTIAVSYYIAMSIFFREDLKKLSSFIGALYPRSQSVFNFLFRI
jgi:teichuronic acid exporter